MLQDWKTRPLSVAHPVDSTARGAGRGRTDSTEMLVGLPQRRPTEPSPPRSQDTPCIAPHDSHLAPAALDALLQTFVGPYIESGILLLFESTYAWLWLCACGIIDASSVCSARLRAIAPPTASEV
ncbi:hypothetical protein C6P46_006687 [Rhodotorula mucilaginosa]|uniref:Uncharacterized protein n=1 Tax=Rhodotorula mucilaginosa TaxID=5537 RepID=A0A9P7B373_RHOMI|nr:hypothetical protein C6P46_006687 [Rhodotorula mucilaginosa]